MSGSYRVGIIGCGGMGGSHARHWTQKPQTDVVAVADVSERGARKLADEFDAKPYTDFEEMLEQESCDIVSVTTWQNVRAEITVKAAESGAKGILGRSPWRPACAKPTSCWHPARSTASSLPSATSAGSLRRTWRRGVW